MTKARASRLLPRGGAITKKRRTTIWLAADEHDYLAQLSASGMQRAAGGLRQLLQILRTHDIQTLTELEDKLRRSRPDADRS